MKKSSTRTDQKNWINGLIRRSNSMSASKSTIGYAVQLGGIAALVLGAVLSAHHAAIAAAFLGGAAAFYVGEKIRTLA
jgi:hypothetical protein